MNVCLSLSSISGVSLSAVLGAVLCAARQNPLGLGALSVPPGQARCSRLLALLADLDSAIAAGLEQVCTAPILMNHFTRYWINHDSNYEESAGLVTKLRN